MLDATPPVTTRQVSVTEAARELGISPETVRRRIKAGQLAAERAIRPQGTVWLVTLPVTTPRGVLPVTPVAGPSEASPSESEQAPSDEAWHPSPHLAHHTDDAAPLVASIARLIAELAEIRVVSDRRADQLVSQAETIGRQSAELERAASIAVKLSDELDAARAQISTLEATTAPLSAESTTEASMSRWRRHLPWLIAAAVLTVMVALFMFAPGVR